MKRPKFPECETCKYFVRRSRRQNPICADCGAGQFFEPRVSTRAPSDDELMDLYRKTYDE